MGYWAAKEAAKPGGTGNIHEILHSASKFGRLCSSIFVFYNICKKKCQFLQNRLSIHKVCGRMERVMAEGGAL